MASTTAAKEQIHELMVEMFSMIEGLQINESLYLQFADLFKKMNFNINQMNEVRKIVVQNIYYLRESIQKTTTIRRKRLTEEEKRKDTMYVPCSCGRYVQTRLQKNHLKTQVHYQGLRNIKLASRGLSDEQIAAAINREVALQAFIIRHLIKVKHIDPDNIRDDEIL